MIDAGEVDQLVAVADAGAEGLDIAVEVEQQAALQVIADHALGPEEGADAGAARDRLHPVDAG